jgi:hypothetical protein
MTLNHILSESVKQNLHEDALLPVYAATYDHIGVILWGTEQVTKTLARDFDWLERHPDFCIGLDNEAYSYDYLAKEAPELLLQLKDALRRYAGRLSIGTCTYGQPLAAFINEESNIRQITYALDTVEEHLGMRVTVYMTSEHAFHAQMPQILAKCGMRGAVLRTHFMMYGHNPEVDAPVIWWIGADGSRIAALPTYIGQADTPSRINHILPNNTSTLDNRILTDGATEAIPLTLADFRRRFGHIQPLVATRADDIRNTEALIAAHPAPSYRWITLEDAFDLLPHPQVELRTQADDFKFRMPWGYCGNWIWRRSRQAEVKILTAERLAAIRFALDGTTQSQAVKNAWKDLLVGQHHDIHICGLEKDAELFLGRAIEKSEAIVNEAMQAIGTRIGNAPSRTIAFNPLPWRRQEVIQVDGQEQWVDLPALGFAQIDCSANSDAPTVPFAWDARALRLTTPHYDISMASTGGFLSLIDRESHRAFFTPPRASGTLAGLIDGRHCESIGTISDVRLNVHTAVIAETGHVGNIPYRSEWTFYAHSRRIDWRGTITFDGQWIGRPKHATDIENKEAATDNRVPAFDDHEYKLRLRFFPYLSPFVRGIRDYPFGIAETGDRYLNGNYWTAVNDGHLGLALFNRGQMGSIREQDGGLSSVLAFALPYVWGTRMLQGEYQFELGVLPFLGDWKTNDLHRLAYAYNFPFVTSTAVIAGDVLGAAWSPYVEKGEGALMTALYENKGRIFARFHEYQGGNATAAFEWMGKPVNLHEVDMRENPLSDLGTNARLDPWQITTVDIT